MLKGNLWKIATISIIIIIVSITLIYIYIGNSLYKPENILYPETIFEDPNNYIGKNITVEGYFFNRFDSDTNAYISSVEIKRPILEGDLENSVLLLMDYSSSTINLDESTLYRFHGLLTEFNNTEFPVDRIILNVYSVEKV